MADLRIRNVESRGTQPAGQPWPVTVAVNNLETVAFAWEAGTCNENGEPGHKARVTLTVRGPMGDEVWSETKRTCVPRNRVGQMLGANKRVGFTPEVSSKGDYTLVATVESVNSVGEDTSDPVRVAVTGVEETEQANNETDSGVNYGDAFDGDTPVAGLSTTQQAALAGVALLVVMMIARPYASLGAEVAG